MEKIKNLIWNRIHSENKLPKKNQLLIVLLVGVLLLVIAIPISPQADEAEINSSEDIMQGYSASESSGETNSAAQYEAYLEKRVASALEYVEGVGKTEVIITLKSSSQKVVEKDQTSDTRITEEEDSAGGTRTENSRSSDKTSVYAQSSDGSQTPYVSKELTPEIAGVVVIAQGGDNAVVVQNITEAIQALFGVEAHKIKIMKRTAT